MKFNNFFEFQNDEEDGVNCNHMENNAADKKEKATLGRLRLLTAPPGSLRDSEDVSPRDSDLSPYDVKIMGEPRKSRRKPVSRANSFGNKDRENTYTQFALMDDDNISALQTKGGTGITLASQWKSQFDDSEETTDNEWRPEKIQYVSNPQLVPQQVHPMQQPQVIRFQNNFEATPTQTPPMPHQQFYQTPPIVVEQFDFNNDANATRKPLARNYSCSDINRYVIPDPAFALTIKKKK